MNVRFATFMSCAFPLHPPMKVANQTFISYICIYVCIDTDVNHGVGDISPTSDATRVFYVVIFPLYATRVFYVVIFPL